MSCCLLALYSNTAFIQLVYRDGLAVLYCHKCMQILLCKALGFLNFSKYANGAVADRAQKKNQTISEELSFNSHTAT